MVHLDIKVDRMRDEVTGQFVTNKAFKNLRHAAAAVRLTAKGLLKPTQKFEQRRKVNGKRQKRVRYRPTTPGKPPSAASGRLKRSIFFAADEGNKTFFVGPKHSAAADVGSAHEVGGEFRGGTYPARPFMGPALERNLHRLPASLAGSIGG